MCSDKGAAGARAALGRDQRTPGPCAGQQGVNIEQHESRAPGTLSSSCEMVTRARARLLTPPLPGPSCPLHLSVWSLNTAKVTWAR